MNENTWTVGPEYDESLFERLGLALKQTGFELKKNWSGVAGSQDITQWHATSSRGQLLIEAETYIGLTVKGPEELVQEVRKHFQKTPC